MAERVDALVSVSLDPSPVIDAYKAGVDRTLIRENLKLTPEQRLMKMMSVLRFHEDLRTAKKARDK